MNEYNLKDHLGNNRVTFMPGSTAGSLNIVQKAHYYPFGLVMKQTNEYSDPSYSKNKYLYNGKEYQDEALNNKFFGMYDYGARFYDPQIGRFHSVDPLASSMEHFSPYSVAANNPILLVDIFGLAPVYNWEKEQYEEDGKKVNWDYVQQSYQIGEYSKTPTNLLLMPTDFSDDSGGALAMMLDAALEHGTIRTLSVSGTKDAANQIAEFMGDDKEIGNLIIGSHGGYKKASFKIGGTLYNSPNKILNDKNLSKISGYIGDESQIILQACHAGSPQNGGTDLLKAMAIKMKATVFGNQSWGVTGSYMFGGFLLGTIPWYQTSKNGKAVHTYEERQHAFDQLGKWTKVTYSNGETKVTTIKNVHYTKSGGIRYDE